MVPFVYDKLDKAKEEIRLVSLLPNCDFDEAIRLAISHTSFKVPERKVSRKVNLPIDEITQTLPEGWDVRVNLEGRLIYSFWDGRSEFWTSWSHPLPNSLPVDTTHKTSVAFEPKYEALSYTWGSNINSETAYIENRETGQRNIPGESTLEIGQNLAKALRHLRHADQARQLWIDAICINQRDIIERSEQIARMRHIRICRPSCSMAWAILQRQCAGHINAAIHWEAN
jgi:hypothetical protein